MKESEITKWIYEHLTPELIQRVKNASEETGVDISSYYVIIQDEFYSMNDDHYLDAEKTTEYVIEEIKRDEEDEF